MLNWAKRFNIFCYLDNQQYQISPHQYECLLAAGVARFVDAVKDLEAVDSLLSSPNWTFGHLSYDFKNRLLGIPPTKTSKIDFPDFYFFQPEILISLQQEEVTIQAKNPQEIYAEILQQKESAANDQPNNFFLQQRQKKEAYIQTIEKLQKHILRGDCYEINFCTEFYAEEASIDPFTVFKKLAAVSPVPFSALYRLNDKYLICASPERFIAKTGNKIYSQPMKGTARRNITDTEADQKLKEKLRNDAKEQAENVMVVDLVRNDLSKICKDATVKVDELFGIYSFPQVHQMVSTVSGMLKDEVRFSEIIRATFPMGSMTGAPKQRVMELIDKYELVARGLFSGSVGYINPQENFDFNVVIRSILYNASAKYLSFQVGSGITFYSDPEKEWEECLLKGEAIKKVLTQ